jgi:adenine-specific DNA methylase
MTAMTSVRLIPFGLKDAPALIETVFPVQKVSFEAQRERKAGAGQTLTALGSYWKGRKPLILVRAILLGSLLPHTDDAEQDLELFEALMAFDIRGLGRRAVVQAVLKPADIARMIMLKNPWDYFDFKIPNGSELHEQDVNIWGFPLDAEEKGLKLSWKRGINDEAKADIYAQALATLPSYEERSLLCKRPEEMDQTFLLAPVWPKVNERLGYLGVNAHSMDQLVEQLGILRFGHRPKVADTFAGGGSIPFEAARMGCDVYASDLNPIACMLTWGAINIIGASPERRGRIEKAQREVAKAVDKEITALGIEHDEQGNRAKVYLYCVEARCPETGWLVPLAPSWVVSMQRNVVARLIPDYDNKRFNIEVFSDVTPAEMKQAARGTVQDGALVYEIDGKSYRTPVKTLRGDYRTETGEISNRLRPWVISDFRPRKDDIFQERLYCIQWITKETLKKPRQETFFAAVTKEDLEREGKVEGLVLQCLSDWQAKGLVPDMAIEPGYNTDQPIRERGWTYWHHLFSPRQLLSFSFYKRNLNDLPDDDIKPALVAVQSKSIEWNTKLCRWATSTRHENQVNTFSNQALNTLYNYGVRAIPNLENHSIIDFDDNELSVLTSANVVSCPADKISCFADLYITDPPYADAVHYHEITEFFIAWLRKNPPAPFNDWTWDSRRALAIKGDGDDFRRGMIEAYLAMTNHMPDNGMQCVMFTHQSTEVWSDMVGIFWAASLQVVAAWYIATETTSEQKKGGYVQGTVTLMLRKRPAGEKVGFKQRILPVVRKEVASQIDQMMNLNDEVKARMGEPVFNDADLQMAGYAAALKVLTSYTKIGETDVTTFALRPRTKGEVTVVDEIVQQASEAANSLLVPEGVQLDTWHSLSGIQRFYLRMLDMESVGASKLDNYQNFAKAFRVEDYTKVMTSMVVNNARLKQVDEFSSRDLTDSTEIGSTWLGQLIIAVQQLLGEVEPQTVLKTLAADLSDYMEIRLKLIDLATFLSRKSRSEAVRSAAEILAARMQNQRALDQ